MSLWGISGLIDSKAMTNLIVIGDAHYEMDAGLHFQKSFSGHCTTKRIKFKENPSGDDLTRQLQMVNKQFNHIMNSFESFNLKLEKSCFKK